MKQGQQRQGQQGQQGQQGHVHARCHLCGKTDLYTSKGLHYRVGSGGEESTSSLTILESLLVFPLGGIVISHHRPPRGNPHFQIDDPISFLIYIFLPSEILGNSSFCGLTWQALLTSSYIFSIDSQ